MAGDSPEEIKKAIKKYCIIGGCLFIGTVLTVAVAVWPPLDFGNRGFSQTDLVIGLLIASVKASLVMYVFMHLNAEKKLVYFIYAMAIVFALFLYFLTSMAFSDPIKADHFEKGLPTLKE